MSTAASSRAVLWAAVGVIALGVVLRLLGFFDLQLWCDEAGWDKRLVDGDYGWIRPVGYMWLTRQLIHVVNSEQTVRALSYVAGLAQLPLAYFVLRRLVTRPLLAVGGVYLLAINPIAVAMTKEFKPYSVESALHLALILLTLIYLEKKSARVLAAIIAFALLAPLFAWTIVFLYPAVFAGIGLVALREKNKAHVVAVVAGCVATLGALGLLAVQRVLNRKASTEFWGQKYDVFYIGHSFAGRIWWYLKKTASLATFPAELQWFWPGGLIVVAVVMGALVALGIAALVMKKKWAGLALLTVPWLCMLVFNVAKQWPYGVFRTNVFFIFYAAALIVIGVDALLDRVPATVPKKAVLAAGVVVAVVLFPFELTAFQHKRLGTLTAETNVYTAMQRLHELTKNNPGKEILALDGHACSSMRYYRDYHSEGRATLHDYFRDHFDVTCSKFKQKRWLERLDDLAGRDFWAISAKRGFVQATRDHLQDVCNPVVDQEWPEGTTLLYHCLPKSPIAADAPRTFPLDTELVEDPWAPRAPKKAAAAADDDDDGENP